MRVFFDGVCQITGWNPHRTYGKDLCEAYHIVWHRRGGDDDIENMILVSPNVHHAIHACDAHLDFSDGSFVFSGFRQWVVLNKHLPLIKPSNN